MYKNSLYNIFCERLDKGILMFNSFAKSCAILPVDVFEYIEQNDYLNLDKEIIELVLNYSPFFACFSSHSFKYNILIDKVVFF